MRSCGISPLLTSYQILRKKDNMIPSFNEKGTSLDYFVKDQWYDFKTVRWSFGVDSQQFNKFI